MKLLPYILLEKYNIYILALEMASPGNQHCANCIGTLSLPTRGVGKIIQGVREQYFDSDSLPFPHAVLSHSHLISIP